MRSINNNLAHGKLNLTDSALLLLIVIMAFGLGWQLSRANTNEQANQPITVMQRDLAVLEDELSGSSGKSSAKVVGNTRALPNATKPPAAAIVYGSINGTKYYSLDCPAGNRIKDQNKIFFRDQVAALASGYQPAVNCDF